MSNRAAALVIGVFAAIGAWIAGKVVGRRLARSEVPERSPPVLGADPGTVGVEDAIEVE